jgi:3-hydroxybutyryl-CoA dehydratase
VSGFLFVFALSALAGLRNCKGEIMTGSIGPGHYFEDLHVGMEASLARTVGDNDLHVFASLTGDANPIHLDEVYAADTPFRQRIAHGMLSSSYISAVFGTKLPGPGCVYISQTLNFRAPVFIGDHVTATVRISDLIERRKRAIFTCSCAVGPKIVVEGEAVIQIPSRVPK